jgi:hypothetical protein
MRARTCAVATALVVVSAGSVAAQVRIIRPPARPRQPIVRISAGVSQQTTMNVFEDDQTFQQYFETGSFNFTRNISKPPLFDIGVAVRVFRGLHAGMTLSFLNTTGAGTLTAEVPHPLLFDQKRPVTADMQNIVRMETGEHFQVSWTAPTVGGLEFTGFGGPSIFMTQQTYVTELALGLDRETYPFDTFPFSGATTATFKDTIIGYNAGVDLTWRFSKHVGVGLLLRYANGKKNFTPAGGVPFKVEAGGLHAGGGLRFIL